MPASLYDTEIFVCVPAASAAATASTACSSTYPGAAARLSEFAASLYVTVIFVCVPAASEFATASCARSSEKYLFVAPSASASVVVGISATNATVPSAFLNVIVLSAVGSITVRVVSNELSVAPSTIIEDPGIRAFLLLSKPTTPSDAPISLTIT